MMKIKKLMFTIQQMSKNLNILITLKLKVILNTMIRIFNNNNLPYNNWDKI